MTHLNRACAVCGDPIPATMRRDARACSRRCRNRKTAQRRADLVAFARSALS